MRPQCIVLLTPEEVFSSLAQGLHDVDADLPVVGMHSLEQLRAVPQEQWGGTTLIGYGTGVIVPREILDALDRPAYNFHGASPDFPGRDPHHWAVFDRASRFGAVFHVMTARVDDGPILDVEWCDVPPATNAYDLAALARECMLRLFRRQSLNLAAGVQPPPLGLAWGSRKRSREDLLSACRLSPIGSREEFDHAYAAFDGGAYDNLYLDIHGYRFRIDKTPASIRRGSSVWDEFTEEGYLRLLRVAKERYRFALYGQTPPEPHVLWRHDIDFSPHRALALAEIERKEGVVATYLVQLHSSFYNVLEFSIAAKLRAIAGMGHVIGLHFEAPPGPVLSHQDLIKRMDSERHLLGAILGLPIGVVSFHNPEHSGLLAVDDDVVAGMINTYGRTLRRDYTYCSDSNGLWRHQPLISILTEDQPERLQVLTHPECWQQSAMPPRARFERCAIGRARAVLDDYDSAIAAAGRPNLS